MHIDIYMYALISISISTYMELGNCRAMMPLIDTGGYQIKLPVTGIEMGFIFWNC